MYWYIPCVRTYFRQFVVSLKNPNFCSLLLGAGAEAGAGVGSGLKIPGAGAVPKQAGSETLVSNVGHFNLFFITARILLRFKAVFVGKSSVTG